MLKLLNIKKNYKITKDEFVPALKGLNIEFRENEFVAILGPSGCGKTTLLNILGGLDKYSEGDLIIDGISTKEYKDRDWDAYRNDRVGFVFQNYNLIPHLSVLGNVELALTLSGISRSDRKKRAIEALKQVGLEDKINKRPNQLSGGQMQRVAIARAIVNDPDIILADEPTGALDSKTSVQIMEILKKISKSRLVIMVTHNPNLAEKYSTRIVNLLDGEIISDSNPYNSLEKNKIESKKKKTSMSFFTALSLSFKNLIKKKSRTILTSIAGSIGIIGIALVLAISNGFQKYIDKMQADTLSSYPLIIEEETENIDAIINSVREDESLKKYPALQEVYINNLTEAYENMYIKNNITEEYVTEVIEKIDPSLTNGISYNRRLEYNFFTNSGFMKQTIGDQEYYYGVSSSIWQEMLNNEKFILSQYDILNENGRLPQAKDEVVIVVDKYNRLSDIVLTNIGLYTKDQEKESYTFEELLNIEFKILTNDQKYLYDTEKGYYVLNGKTSEGVTIINDETYNSGLTLKVVGILRAKPDTAMGILNSGLVYSHLLTEYILEQNKESDLVNYMNANPNINPLEGSEITEKEYYNLLQKYGANDIPKSINIYPKDFNSKNEIKEYLNNYNETKEETERVIYTDIMQIMFDALSKMVDIITYVLVGFTAISLVVSSIMIAIITYVSVIERTKEIGVLRSIGARKKDISRVFNAETFIIGLFAGVFGILIAIVLTIPINVIISSLVSDVGNIASLNILHAIVLIIISVILTLLSGFIPAKMAAKKNPVEALRSE